MTEIIEKSLLNLHHDAILLLNNVGSFQFNDSYQWKLVYDQNYGRRRSINSLHILLNIFVQNYCTFVVCTCFSFRNNYKIKRVFKSTVRHFWAYFQTTKHLECPLVDNFVFVSFNEMCIFSTVLYGPFALNVIMR